MSDKLNNYKDLTGEDYVKLLRYCIQMQESDFARLESLQASYDNKIDEANWPTQSMIPTAQSFIAVEEALGPALDGCFPESDGVQLLPSNDEVTPDQWRNAEWGLWTMVNYRMKLRNAALKSLKDCFKCSVGYGIVEPTLVYPDERVVKATPNGSRGYLRESEPVVGLQYRYVSPGRIVPFPEGTDFNGPEATPYAFFYDPMPLWEFQQILEGEHQIIGIPKEEITVTLDEATAAAREDARHGPSDFKRRVLKLGGRSETATALDTSLNGMPLKVPIVRVFIQPNIEVWVMLEDRYQSGKVIFSREIEGPGRLRVPLVKWSAWPDGDRWFPMSVPEADQMRGVAYDMFLNFFFDMMSETKDPQRVINRTAVGPNNRELAPKQDIFVDSADARTAVSYLSPPRVDPSIPAVGEELRRLGDDIQGQKDPAARNFTRGGTMAFTDLLNTMQARERMVTIILELGALTQIYEHVLAYMQGLSSTEDIRLFRPVYDDEAGRKSIEARTITSEDLAHAYELLIDTTERRMLGGMNSQERIELFRILDGRPDTRPEEVNKILPLPTSTQPRVFRKREELERIQQENRDLEVGGALAQTAQALGGAEAGATRPPEATPPGGEQAAGL